MKCARAHGETHSVHYVLALVWLIVHLWHFAQADSIPHLSHSRVNSWKHEQTGGDDAKKGARDAECKGNRASGCMRGVIAKHKNEESTCSATAAAASSVAGLMTWPENDGSDEERSALRRIEFFQIPCVRNSSIIPATLTESHPGMLHAIMFQRSRPSDQWPLARGEEICTRGK